MMGFGERLPWVRISFLRASGLRQYSSWLVIIDLDGCVSITMLRIGSRIGKMEKLFLRIDQVIT